MINKSKNTLKRGFTIIETLMAVLILSLAMAGALALAARGLEVITVARQEVAAGFLAQDAMEYVRALRDTNCLGVNQTGLLCTNGTWLTVDGSNLLTLCSGSTGCYIDTLDSASGVKVCPSTGCPPLQYNDTAKHYTYSDVGAISTIYTRSVLMQTPLSNTDEASTTILVSWSSAGGTKHSVRIHDDLYNWQ